MNNLKLSKASSWAGVWTALITPLKSEDGTKGALALALALDLAALAKLIESQIAAGIHGFVIAGSTGEGSLLGEGLYRELLQSSAKIVKGRVHLVAGLGIGGTQSCLRNLKIAKSLNYDGVLASPPAYVKAPQRGLEKHFLTLAAEGLPLCLYEISGRAASTIELATLERLAHSTLPEAKNIVAIKDASGDMKRAKQSAQILAGKLALLSGDDGSFAAFLEAGGDGVISVVSHVLPKAMNQILRDSKAGLLPKAAEEQMRIRQVIDALFTESNPIPVKSLLAQLGFAKPVFCEPLCPMNTELLSKLRKLLDSAGTEVRAHGAARL